MADNSAPLDELTDKLEKLTAKLDNAHRRMREAMDDRDSRHAADMARIRIAWDALNAERSLWYARADRAEALNKETLEQNAKLLSERVMWENTAMQESRNRAYYVDLLNQIGQCLGDDSFIADDGTRSEEPLDLTANAWSLRAGGLRDLLSRSERTLKTSAINMHAIPVQGPLELRIRALREALELFDKRTVCGDYPEDDHASLSEAVEKLRTLIKEAEQELQNRPAGHLIVPEAGSKS